MPIRATRVLFEIAQALDGVNDAPLRLERTLALLRELVRSERCAIVVTPHEKKGHQFLVSPAQSEVDHAALRAHVIELLELLERDEQVAPRASSAQAALPLIGLDQVVGFLYADRARRYSERELRLFSLVAAQLGSYLATLRLHEHGVVLDRFKHEMTMVLVHDLKNPLAVVLANLDYMAVDLAGTSNELQECVSDARGASERMLRLVSSLLDLERLESAEVRLQQSPCSLAMLIEKLVRPRRAWIEKHGIDLRVSDPQPPIWAEIDEDLVTRVLENILDNAARYTPKGGRLEIDLARRGSRAELRIGNDGPPIPPADRHRIFEKFGQAATGGRLNLGLGLYFGSLVVQAHGGTIRVEESDSLPTIFCFDLPLAAPPEAAAPAKER